MMRNISHHPSRFSLGNPKNGHQRVIVDRDDIKHLEFFMNGSWRHDPKCRELTNKDCRSKFYGK
jgi:hypothetical protein